MIISLHSIPALRFFAQCNGCGARSEKICAEELPIARATARARLELLGWAHRVMQSDPRPHDWVEREGASAWFCPRCVAP